MANHYTREIPKLLSGELQQLQQWVRRRNTAQGVAFRARIILACAEGESDVKVAARLNTTRETVGKRRRKFLKARCDGLLDEPRPGAPRKMKDEELERVAHHDLGVASARRDSLEYSLDG